MKLLEALRALNTVSAYQWGMATSAQASQLGVTTLELYRLTSSGLLDRVGRGVYRVTGAPADPYEALKAAWLSTDPKRTASVRLADGTAGVIVAGTSAARLHGIGELWADRHDFVSPSRRQSQRKDLRFRVRTLAAKDITMVSCLPVMSIERTIADLLDDLGDLSVVADALRDATHAGSLDWQHLVQLLSPLAARVGFKPGDGYALLDYLAPVSGQNFCAEKSCCSNHGS